MWIFLMFDLPTNTKAQRKAAQKFRKQLLKNGFTMMQYSVYSRHCPDRANAETHINRIKLLLPDEGLVEIIVITDKQFSNMRSFWGKAKTTPRHEPKQLEIF